MVTSEHKKEYNSKYYEKNRDKSCENAKINYWNNRDEINKCRRERHGKLSVEEHEAYLEYLRNWRLDNKGYTKDKNHEWYLNNKESHRVCNRNWSKTEKGKESQKRRNKRWQPKHKEWNKIWFKTDAGKKWIAKKNSKRRNKWSIPIFPNIFPEDIPINWHHIDGNIFTVPLPEVIHKRVAFGKNVEKHIEEANSWVEFYYDMDPLCFITDVHSADPCPAGIPLCSLVS